MKNLIAITCLLLSTSCTFYAWTSSHKSPPTFAEQAEAYVEDGELEKAIKAYQRHITQRKNFKGKPAEENPYFYQLLIGDLHLRLDQPEQAALAYLSAHEQSVTQELVADRMRNLADYYVAKGNREKAIQILSEHRELDELMYDGRIDEIHKEAVREEQEGTNAQSDDDNFSIP